MIGDVIKKLRQNKGIYQQDLATELSVSKSTVAMWETNRRTPDATMLRKIADFFSVSVDFLLSKPKKIDTESIKKSSNAKMILLQEIENIDSFSDDKVERLIGYIRALKDEI